MRITLYSIPNCVHAKAFRIFLERNKLPYTEIPINEKNIGELKKLVFWDKIDVSVLKIMKNHGPETYRGFDEQQLNLNIVEHIKKYGPKVEI